MKEECFQNCESKCFFFSLRAQPYDLVMYDEESEKAALFLSFFLSRTTERKKLRRNSSLLTFLLLSFFFLHSLLLLLLGEFCFFFSSCPLSFAYDLIAVRRYSVREKKDRGHTVLSLLFSSSYLSLHLPLFLSFFREHFNNTASLLFPCLPYSRGKKEERRLSSSFAKFRTGG